MFLSILDLESDCIHIPVAFKFHYDSINSASNEELHGSHRSSLNSIMFLLIQESTSMIWQWQKTLNSIMFLLILKAYRDEVGVWTIFKFHYVSINSTAMKIINKQKQVFKFHYVSINSIYELPSALQQIIFKFHYVSINSHSGPRSNIALEIFKFHYVSINSLVSIRSGLL